ncbi:MAG: tyrosine-protein phosphatase [Candidatus Methanomethylophilaceae archaeon]|nr:tyrosine-protein phosphatase [Candidatus Methanomethylophilaceae archaeon]
MKASWALIPVVVAAIVAILAGTFLLQNDDNGAFEAKLVGEGSSSSIKLDVPRDEFYAHGIELGDRLALCFPDKTYYAYFICDRSGIASLDMYVNCYSKDQEVEIGIYDYDINLLFDYDMGTEFTVCKEGGKADYFDKIPHYSAGYSDDREDFSSSQGYGNYREVTQGSFKQDRLYRSASPMQHNGTRFLYCDEFLRSVGADYVFSISIDIDEVESYRYPGSYAFSLYDEGKVVAKNLSPSILCHKDEILFVMDTILSLDGSVGISCSQGKDRTGLYCAILESLAGASYKEVRDDYLLSMCNYCGIAEGSEEYDTVGSMVIDRIFYIFQNPEILDHVTDVDWSGMDISGYDAEGIVTGYLLGIGMDEGKLNMLKSSLRTD